MKKIVSLIEDALVKIFRPIIKKILDWDNVEDEINTMRYIVNNYIDITKFPKATGLLRQCQLADAELLRIVHEICQKHNIQYWLGYGTLLGALRHGGFIPWDDDLDICMTREDYNKALIILPDELKKFNISMGEPTPKKISINIWKAGLVLDIFPADSVDSSLIKNRDDLRRRLVDYRKYFVKHRFDSTESLEKAKNKIIGPPAMHNPIWYHNVEFNADSCLYENDMIFPLKKMTFEGYEFFVPNDCHRYLTVKYGDYMSVPKNGVLHHFGGRGKPLYENSIKHGVDMNAFLEEIRRYKVD